MSISSHKMYGPKGVGALYVRRKPRVRLQAMINGGGQERGMRSGTLSPPLCVGFGTACEIGENEMGKDNEHIRRLSDRLYDGLMARLPDITLNGDRDQRFPGNMNLSFAFVEGESLMMGMRDVAVSSGSACTSASLEPSYVLRALGVQEEMAHTSIRMGIGRMTSESEIDYVIETIVKHVTKLRDMSPLWEMAQDGIDLRSVEWSDH
jgi:cysteine desulfurase